MDARMDGWMDGWAGAQWQTIALYGITFFIDDQQIAGGDCSPMTVASIN
jgi:hypothetical protein